MTDVIIPREAINDAYIPYLNNTSRVSIFFGGASSGKSVFLAQRDIIDVMKGGRNFLVCRQIGRTLRGSVVQEITKIIKEWGLSDLFNINKTDGTVTCSNGYQIIFAGLDDVEKLKSVTPALGVFTDIRIDEATETDMNSLKQLLKRQRGGSKKYPKRLVLSFNPILKSHFLFKEYFSKLGWADDQKEYTSPALSILKTTYKDNQFLTPDDVYDLESETDEYYKSVYTDGNWGILGGAIFTNWRVEDLSAMSDQFTNRRNGLDFGFSSDPAAMPVSHYDRMRKIIYIYKELYETGLTNDLLSERVKDLVGVWEWKDTGQKDEDGTPIVERVCTATERITADSSEPKSIQELRNHGVDAYGARKGKDSVRQGIDWLKQQTIIVDVSCINTQNELSQYHWKKDAGGNSLKVPVDKNNHLIDALRYAYESEMLPLGEVETIENPFYS
jgi:phage terminase large subunit